jgi:regulator of protease activity HflC (stomatin/prohibitin superfamily)
MRIDHHAYRKATGVAGFGLLLQAAMAIILVLFARAGSPDTVLQFTAAYFLGGLLIWGSLIAVFYQHRQERLEALEEDELAATRGSSVFESDRGEKPAARRLRLMHKWLLPIVSILLAGYLALSTWLQWNYMRLVDDPGDRGTDFFMTPHRGWAVAVCLSFALVSFIFSRFVAGMSRQAAWQNLRGGAGYMVGNALVLLTATVGLIFRFFERDGVMQGVGYVIPVFMLILAGEIGFNFILHLYRPRVPGEVPRPSFDSKLLSLLAAPESFVQSISDAINYQFGFDITSSWGYKLLIRSVGWLVAFAILVVIGLNMMVVVEPHQRAIRLARGDLVGEEGEQVHAAGIMWKLPWPLQSAAVYDTSRIRTMALTQTRREDPDVQLWSQEIPTAGEREPFIVAGSRRPEGTGRGLLSESVVSVSDAGAGVGELFAFVDAEILLRYRIKPDGLLDYLSFSSDVPRRSRLNMREGALKAVALREITQELSRGSLESVIAAGRADLLETLRVRLQAAFDRHRTGVEVVALDVPLLRPAGQVGTNFEDLNMARQQRRMTAAQAEAEVLLNLVIFVGDAEMAERIAAEIDRHRELQRELDDDDPALIEQRLLIERLLAEAGGRYSDMLAAVEADRWVELMNARAQVNRFEGKIDAYRAAPRLFREREIMNAFRRSLAGRPKIFVIGVDPGRVVLDVELREEPSLLTVPNQGESP